MSQSKGMSFVESWVNVAIGFGINFTANMLVLPLFGFHVTAAQSFGIGIIFTFISVGRSYLIRRWFNGLIKGKQDDDTKEVSDCRISIKNCYLYHRYSSVQYLPVAKTSLGRFLFQPFPLEPKVYFTLLY